MESSESRIAPSPETESDDFVSPVHPELAEDRLYWRGVADGIVSAGGVVPPEIAGRAGPPGPGDALAFDPVPLRRRRDGLTPERQRAYVEALVDTGVAREAAARVGITEQAVGRARRRADGRSFDLACEAAHRMGARNVLRSVAYQRAIEGTIRRHYYHGELKSEERVYDNRLLIYLIGKTAHLFDGPEQAEAICDQWEPAMEALERGLPLPTPSDDDESPEAADEPQVWQEKGVWWTFFPPPDGFRGKEKGEFGKRNYRRTLTAEEESAMRARLKAEENAELAHCCAVRDQYFGLAARGAPGLSSPREAETYETCEASAALPPPAAEQAEPPAAVEQGRESAISRPGDRSEGGSGP